MGVIWGMFIAHPTSGQFYKCSIIIYEAIVAIAARIWNLASGFSVTLGQIAIV